MYLSIRSCQAKQNKIVYTPIIKGRNQLFMFLLYYDKSFKISYLQSMDGEVEWVKTEYRELKNC